MALVVLWVGPARAERLTFAFTGAISDLTDYEAHFDEAVGLGTVVHGTLSFEASLPNVSPVPDLGIYGCNPLPGGACPYSDLAVLALQVGTTGFEVPFLTLRVVDALPGPGFFDDQFDASGATGLREDAAGFFDLNGAFLLTDPTDLVLDSVALPVLAPDLDLWGSARFSFAAYRCDNPLCNYTSLAYLVAGDIESIALVPEPGSLSLSGTGLLVLAWARRLRKRRRGVDGCA